MLVDIEGANVDEGENFCISVTVDNFSDVAGMSFTLSYNPSQLEFVEVTNLNTNIPGFSLGANIGTPPAIAAGNITVVYDDASLNGVTLPDGAVLFDVCFEGLSAGTSSISMTSAIAPAEFSNSDEQVIPSDSDPGTITVNSVGGNEDLIVDIENASVTEGDNFCVSVSVDNFTDVIGMSFTLNYNASQLEFVEVANVNTNIPGFSQAANIGTPPGIAAGNITVVYDDATLSGATLPDGAVLFDICFEAIDAGNSSITMAGNIAPIEFANTDEEVIPSDDNPGIIQIEEGVNTTDIFLTIEDMMVDPGESFCLEITTLNFEDVVGNGLYRFL